MTGTRHLVSVWNPAYAVDAMEATASLLLRVAQDHRRGDADEEDVYVWWGKVKSSNRQQPMAHLAEILAMDNETSSGEDLTGEMHLYLTDYRSLYVGHVASITDEDPTGLADERGHVPGFYAANNFACDCWFQLFDIRRIVTDDTPGVVNELRKLRNTHYNDRPVSIYGGMVDLPLIVTRDDGARYFEADVRDRFTDGKFWVEFDAERAGVGRMEVELRENLFGDQVWNALDPVARGFIATAESIFRAHRYDIAFDFAPMAVEFAKAFELQVNTILRRALRDAHPDERMANVDGSTVDLTTGRLWSLGELARVIGQEQAVNRALKRRLAKPGGEWFTASLPPILDDLASLRNPSAHTERVERDAARKLRDSLVGVGCPGVLNDLGRVRAL